ncbi:MAG: cyclic nucleotide-binding domain-containing protein [Rhodobacteraceae bacterium]|nr:cyclic nucleotide-binding domain-containing protein [Paracoccaceae bacterium]
MSSNGKRVTVGAAAAKRVGGDKLPASPEPPQHVEDSELSNMSEVIALVAERDPAQLDQLRDILSKAGIKKIHAYGELAPCRDLLKTVSPDMIVVGDDLAAGVFDFVREIRHGQIGANPFVLITTLIDPHHVSAVKSAMQAGTDDIIVKPVKPDQLLNRLKRITIHRQAFVVTSDYLGPDRRLKARPSQIRRISVLNTMLDKTSGKHVELEDVTAGVEDSMNDVLEARLDSHGYRLGFVCNLLIEAYQSNNITPDVEQKLHVLVDVLKDAAKTAERLGETELAVICGSLASQVEGIASRYQNPTEKDLVLIRKLTRAVLSAINPKANTEKLQKDAEIAAQNYQQRQRDTFKQAQEIKRQPKEASVAPVDEPVIEIMTLSRGQQLFKQGDPANAAYVVASGSVAVFREIDGHRIPVARIRKGEFFGEMAIIDGTPRRSTAIALEDTTLSLISRQSIDTKMESADPMVQGLMKLLIDSLRKAPEHYSPLPRNALDAAKMIKHEANEILAYASLKDTPPDYARAIEEGSRGLSLLVDEIYALTEECSHQDRRTAALPTAAELHSAHAQQAPHRET